MRKKTLKLRRALRSIWLIGGVFAILAQWQRTIVNKFKLIRLQKYVLYNEFPNFAPNSAGTPSQKTVLTLASIKNTNQILSNFANKFFPLPSDSTLTIDQFLNSKSYNVNNAAALSQKFINYGSDKGEPNNLYKIYGYILSALPNSNLKLLEIGLGSDNLNVVSNMGLHGKPGASLRAFSEHYPAGKFYGGDIDKDILFSTEKIQTAFVDQSSLETLENFFNTFTTMFDLIIDDGLHAPDANLNTLFIAIDYCANGGYVVIEDIHRSSRPIWRILQCLLPTHLFECHIISAWNCDIFLVKKL
jgi:hypothetical protein